MTQRGEQSFATAGDPSLEDKGVIGRGRFGAVHKLYHIPSGKFRARKLMHIPGVDSQAIDDEIRAILSLYAAGGHKHIVTITEIGDIPQNVFIDMELCDLTLHDYIYCKKDRSEDLPYFVKDQPPPMKSQQIWNVMLDIAQGVEFLHTKRMVHRDLKPVNVLYSRKDSVWKVADFGYSTQLQSRSSLLSRDGRGTDGYFPPEFFEDPQDFKYNTKLDIWQMGCVLFELAVGKPAFASNFAIQQFKLSRATKDIPLDEYFSEDCRKNISKSVTSMLRIEPNKRPTASQMVESFSAHARPLREMSHRSQTNIRHSFPPPTTDAVGVTLHPPRNPRTNRPPSSSQSSSIGQQDRKTSTPGTIKGVSVQPTTSPKPVNASQPVPSQKPPSVLGVTLSQKPLVPTPVAPSWRPVPPEESPGINPFTGELLKPGQVLAGPLVSNPTPSAPPSLVSFQAADVSRLAARSSTASTAEIPSPPLARPLVNPDAKGDDRIPAAKARIVKTRPNLDASSFNPELSGIPKKHHQAMLKILKNQYYYLPWHDLCKDPGVQANPSSRIRLFEIIAEKWPLNPAPLIQLTNLYAAHGNYKSALKVGKRLQLFDSDALKLALIGDSANPQRIRSVQKPLAQVLSNPAYIKKWSSETFSVKASTSAKPEFIDKLHYAAWIGDRTMTETLVSNNWGTTNSADGWTALHSAVWNMHIEVVKYLLKFGSWKAWQDQKDGAYSILHFAVLNHDQETLQLLLDAKADVNFVGTLGRTPLHEAIICGNVEAAEALLMAGADKQSLDSSAHPPLFYASGIRDVLVRSELIELF